MTASTSISWGATALAVCTLLAGCDREGPAADSSPSAEPEPTATATPSAKPTDPDRPGDQVRGVRVLTGTVEAGEGCRLVRSGDERWALLGVLSGTLQVGEPYELRGRSVPVPRGCRADRAIEVTQARRS